MLTDIAGIVQGLVRKPSKLDVRVRVPLPAPSVFAGAKPRQAGWGQAKRNAADLPNGKDGLSVKKVLGVRRSWRAGADCKSVGLSLRWFESTHSHQNKNTTVSVVFLFCGRGLWICAMPTKLAGSKPSRFGKREVQPNRYGLPAVAAHEVCRTRESPTFI